MRERVARSRSLVAEGYPVATTARVMQISRQAIYRTPKRPAASRRPVTDPVDRAIVEVAKDNPIDGYRMVWALTRRKLGIAVNRKRVLRVMREQRLIQRRGPHEPRRRRPGFFQVTRPDELWHLDMTSIWVAEHGWCYLNAAIDCCTREIVGWSLELRCRAVEACELIERWPRPGQSPPVSSCSARIMVPPTPPGAPALPSRASASPTADAATATRSHRPSSSPGSAT